MSRLPLAAALIAASAAMASPLSATQSAPYFTAQLAAPTSEERAIAGGVVFRCEETRCAAPRSGDRSLRVCSELRREVGAIASFTANGRALSAAQLARCNG
ncbi:CC_3452 family protein [Aurantiacibacter aquimixticola]|uniref:Uncharacterized protein n=1 Tax=Aurantiacibacter aquimixticola TaxID=1958945 RepID=A0A419RU26_9SPHN|nr:hypothetical protein [Aurantiacibacter aquimixticola]RJY09286.1 hypothetical protein D6201_07885 [Aurantiacibacter aquimixticola]